MDSMNVLSTSASDAAATSSPIPSAAECNCPAALLSSFSTDVNSCHESPTRRLLDMQDDHMSVDGQASTVCRYIAALMSIPCPL